jgi:hypothetical protein
MNERKINNYYYLNEQYNHINSAIFRKDAVQIISVKIK